MTKETHSSGGIIVGLIAFNTFITKLIPNYSVVYQIFLTFLFFHASYIGSLFPDIDMKSSFISKRYPFIAKKFGKKCRHRGFTHSFLSLFLFILFFEVAYIITDKNIIMFCVGLGFILGYISHMILDLLTSEGIELFNPWRINLHILPIKTGSKAEKYLNKSLKIFITFLIVYNIILLINAHYDVDLIKYVFSFSNSKL